jgi:galactoside O-acetyltransferase
MALRPLRPLDPDEGAVRLYERWIGEISDRLGDDGCDRNALCTEILRGLFFPGIPVDVDPDDLPIATRVAIANLDPRSVTLEPEYYHEIDIERYAPVKPLIWLWEMFDKSPLGENVHLGILFRRVLARRIFRKCGKNFKAFHFVKLSFGYNLEVGDDVVIHRHALLDDRGGIRMGNKVSVSDWVNIYSHSHDIVESALIDTPTTIIDDAVRITYHATILAGVHVAEDSMVGAMALANRDTLPHHIHVGIPAKPVRKKPERDRKKFGPDPMAVEK